MASSYEFILALGGKIASSLPAAVENAKSQLNSLAETADKVGTRAIKVGEGLENVGKGLTSKVTLPIVGVGIAALKAGADFDASMSKVSAIGGVTGDNLDALRNKAKEMGIKTKYSATEAADAFTYMGQAGWESQDMLDGVAGVMNLAAASGEDLANTANIMTGTLASFKMEASEAGHAADVLAVAASSSNTSVGMMGESFKYAAPLAGSLGYKIEDVSIALGLMANSNIVGSQAGTTLKTALANLAKPTQDMTNCMSDLGISLTDSSGQMKPLRELIGSMRTGFKDLSEEQQANAAATLFGKESMSGMLAVINTSDEDFDNLASKIDGCAGTAENMANIMNDNLKGDLLMLKSTLEGLAITFSENLEPKIRPVVQKVTELLNSFNNLNPETQAMIFKLIGFSAAIGPVFIGIGKVTKGFGILQKGMGSVIGGIEGGVDKLGKFGGSIVNMGGKVSSLGGTISGKLGGALKKMPGFMQVGVSGISSGVGKITGLFGKLGGKVVGIFDKLGGTVFGKIAGIFGGLGEKIGGIFGKIGGTAIKGLSGFAPMLMSIMGPAVIIGLMVLALGAFGDKLGPIIAKITSEGPKLIEKFVSSIVGKIPDLMDTGVQVLMTIAMAIKANLPVILKGATQILTSIINGITKNLPTLIPMVIDIVMTILNSIVDNLPTILDAGLQLLMALVNGICDNINLIVDGVMTLLNRLIKFFIDNLPMLIDVGLKIIMALVEGLLKALPDIVAGLGTILNTIGDAIKSVDWISLGIDVIKGIVAGITSVGSLIGDTLKNLAKQAFQGIKDFFGIKSPSKLMQEEIGKFIPQGVAVGIEANADSALDAVNALGKNMIVEAGSIKGDFKGKSIVDVVSNGKPNTSKTNSFKIGQDENQPFIINYNPTININGGADNVDDIRNVVNMSAKDIIKILEDYLKNKKRTKFA